MSKWDGSKRHVRLAKKYKHYLDKRNQSDIRQEVIKKAVSAGKIQWANFTTAIKVYTCEVIMTNSQKNTKTVKVLLCSFKDVYKVMLTVE